MGIALCCEDRSPISALQMSPGDCIFHFGSPLFRWNLSWRERISWPGVAGPGCPGAGCPGIVPSGLVLPFIVLRCPRPTFPVVVLGVIHRCCCLGVCAGWIVLFHSCPHDSPCINGECGGHHECCHPSTSEDDLGSATCCCPGGSCNRVGWFVYLMLNQARASARHQVRLPPFQSCFSGYMEICLRRVGRDGPCWIFLHIQQAIGHG